MSFRNTLWARQDGNETVPVSTIPDVHDVPAHGQSPAVAFIIGVSIVLLASILNAGGLNLTKLDHVRTSAIPKASRRKDWMRPLWLLGMILYILSQLIGSTLALRYLRAEYVAPLGATSLIFNFLFASLLIGTPVTSTDIYGTIVVIVGVVGIVAFGSINSGLDNGMDVDRLKELWGRAQWILLFFTMAISLTLVYIFAAQLERVLVARADISAVPFAAQSSLHHHHRGPSGGAKKKVAWWKGVAGRWNDGMGWIAEKLETWTAAKDDKTIAWTLGIAWACCGGGLAGGCLVFARTSVQLISYAVDADSNFAHFTVIITFLFLALTAVVQIICLNRGLRVYDSTLVVPVFYGVYTGTGALDSLVFNDEVGRYHTWTLFLIFLSILVLVSGVVLLTHKKPEPGASSVSAGAARGVGGQGHIALSSIPAARKRAKAKGGGGGGSGSGDPNAGIDRENGSIGDHETEALHDEPHNNDPVVWEVGEDEEEEEEDEDDDATLHGSADAKDRRGHDHTDDPVETKRGLAGMTAGEEGRGLIRRDREGGGGDDDDDEEEDDEDEGDERDGEHW